MYSFFHYLKNIIWLIFPLLGQPLDFTGIRTATNLEAYSYAWEGSSYLIEISNSLTWNNPNLYLHGLGNSGIKNPNEQQMHPWHHDRVSTTEEPEERIFILGNAWLCVFVFLYTFFFFSHNNVLVSIVVIQVYSYSLQLHTQNISILGNVLLAQPTINCLTDDVFLLLLPPSVSHSH